MVTIWNSTSGLKPFGSTCAAPLHTKKPISASKKSAYPALLCTCFFFSKPIRGPLHNLYAPRVLIAKATNLNGESNSNFDKSDSKLNNKMASNMDPWGTQAKFGAKNIPNGLNASYSNSGTKDSFTKTSKSKSSSFKFGTPSKDSNRKDKVVSITYEEIGLFPRSFSRVLDRFLKQIFADVENLVIQEYRFYRYLFLTTIQTIFVLLLVPLFVNFIAKTYLIQPITEYFWNTKQTEIFLNSYEQKRAFLELQDFEEKIYFESLLISNNCAQQSCALAVGFALENKTTKAPLYTRNELGVTTITNVQSDAFHQPIQNVLVNNAPKVHSAEQQKEVCAQQNCTLARVQIPDPSFNNDSVSKAPVLSTLELEKDAAQSFSWGPFVSAPSVQQSQEADQKPALYSNKGVAALMSWLMPYVSVEPSTKNGPSYGSSLEQNATKAGGDLALELQSKKSNLITLSTSPKDAWSSAQRENALESNFDISSTAIAKSTLLQERLQEKTLELAIRYNNHSIEAITNFFADFVSLLTLLYLLVSLEIQINITKSFLLEVFFGLDDSKKSLLILIMTDLLVGYHSSNLWELFFQFLFNHYGIPESQTGIFLLVATLPVLLDVLFKYLIFRHLNRASPATVATYHAIIE